MIAATAAGVASGLAVGDSVLLQDTNNVVVWLRPHAVIAKVGVRPNVGVSLLREVEVCRYLYGVGAPVAEPLAWFDDERLPVSLWNQIEMTGREYSSRDHGVALEIVHAALRGYEAPLPSYWSATDQATRQRPLIPPASPITVTPATQQSPRANDCSMVTSTSVGVSVAG